MTASRYEPEGPREVVRPDDARPETAREVIGRQVRMWRLRRHVSQAGLAQAAGINQASISNYEAGKRELRVSTLIRIADALNVRIDELLDDETRRTVLHPP
jgi:transcriptional regulator with XRE-family HTH domain